jgi:predicted DNA-binding WGR domain protein
MTKFKKSEIPSGHTLDDFECFGPAAEKDGTFGNTKLADFGCFKQDEVDSNKFYHAAVVRSKLNGNYYTYFEWGRQGASPDFQFAEFDSDAAAQTAYEKQCHSKNDKRGEWYDHPALGRILRAKAGKDCYLVRAQATRVTGLPDARKICSVVPTEKKQKKNTAKKSTHKEVTSLLRDLSMGTVTYARTNFANSALPTPESIDRARKILGVAASAAGEELTQLTYDLYSLIPKAKTKYSVWELNSSTIMQWQSDLDAFEDALQNIDSQEEELQLDFELEYVDGDVRRFIEKFVKQGTRNVHYNLNGQMKVKHAWRVNRRNAFSSLLQRVADERPSNSTKALHQIPREDVDGQQRELFERAYTCLMFHGTRSVNVGGILKKGLILPKYLKGVSINGAMFGPGLYHADDWKKSANYCTLNSSIYSGGYGSLPGRSAFMFLNDVVLGRMHVERGWKAFTEPPRGYHSVMGLGGGGSLANNEFITYNQDSVNLRYLVEFSL